MTCFEQAQFLPQSVSQEEIALIRFWRVLIKALRQHRIDRPTPEDVLSNAEKALLRETVLVAAGITVVGLVLGLWWLIESSLRR